MKTFKDYIAFYEESSDDDSKLSSNDGNTFTAAVDAFEAIAARFPDKVAMFLNTYGPQADPSRFQPDTFKEDDLKKGSKKSRKIVSKGLADVTTDDGADGSDVIATNHADSFHNPIG